MGIRKGQQHQTAVEKHVSGYIGLGQVKIVVVGFRVGKEENIAPAQQCAEQAHA